MFVFNTVIIGCRAAIVGDVARQIYEADGSRKSRVYFFDNRLQVEVVLLACAGHMKIADMNPGENSGGVGRFRFEWMNHCLTSSVMRVSGMKK